jgi:tRNA modification GTPase
MKYPDISREDTICALATPPGTGAIAVIRLSGIDSHAIINRLFKPMKAKDLNEVGSHRAVYGQILDKEQLIDDVLLTIFRAPHSYTGEDAIEIGCHGSIFIQQKIIELLLNAGARLAEPGEFTMRAFANKRFDLAQAEAVADLIASRSEAAHHLAINQMRVFETYYGTSTTTY